MPLDTEPKQQADAVLRGILTDIFPGAFEELDEGRYVVHPGPEPVAVLVLGFGEDDAAVHVVGYLSGGFGPKLELPVDARLMRYLLERNSEIVYGAFAVDEEDDISFCYTLPWKGLSGDCLRTAVEVVAVMAARFRGDLEREFGGGDGQPDLGE